MRFGQHPFFYTLFSVSIMPRKAREFSP
jgi:hypothetical protein